MDAIQFLINKLANAAKGGEDNMALLEIVEEIKAEILASESAFEQPELASTLVSVMLPQGFKIKNGQPTEKQSAHDVLKPAAPRPPAVVSTFTEQALPLEQLLPVEQVEEYVISKVAKAPISLDELDSISSPLYIAVEANDLYQIHAPWMPAIHEEETLELPITDEMVHEAVALENLAKQPELVEEPAAVEMQKVVEKPEAQDLNEKLAQRSKVLNEIFTKKEAVLAEVLAEPRITDLRKAISINEKYQYVDSLFRGDEQMFERSIKTLNNFDILPEAQYWMQRELLIKLGWNDEDELVQRFFSLVSRRFS